MKAEKIATAYTILKGAKPTNLESADKIKAIEAVREMRPIAEKYEADIKEAVDMLQDDKHKEMNRRAIKYNPYPNRQLTDEEKKEVKELDDYFTEYNKTFNECIDGIKNRDVSLTFEKLSKEAFDKLIEGNDLSFEHILAIDEVLLP